MSSRLKTLIVDDEPDAVGFIASIIREYCPGLDIVATAGSVSEASARIMEANPDLVFLDVEMPHASGFDLLALFPEKTFDVVFITAFNHYAIKAIKFSAVDYILKPINISEFIEAVGKVAAKRASGPAGSRNYETLLENLRNSYPSKLAIPTSDGMEYLNTREIIRIEADRSYCWFFLTDRRKLLVSKNLKEFQELLGERDFFRPHNSHLINLEYVRKYIRQEGGSIEMNDGSSIPLARLRRELFLAKMKQFSR